VEGEERVETSGTGVEGLVRYTLHMQIAIQSWWLVHLPHKYVDITTCNVRHEKQTYLAA